MSLNNKELSRLVELVQHMKDDDKKLIECMLDPVLGKVRIAMLPANKSDKESRYEVCFDEHFASGGQGSIYKPAYVIKVNEEGEVYQIKTSRKALKIIDKVRNDSGVIDEVKFFGMIHPSKKYSPNGSAHLSTIESERKALISMRLFDGKNIYNFMQNNNLDYYTRLKIAKNIIEAVMDMHDKGIVHHDLKLENLMIDEQTLEVSVIDTGMATQENEEQKRCGTLAFVAPERWLRIRMESKLNQDYFSLAGVLMEVFGANNLNDRVFENNKLSKTKACTKPYPRNGLFNGLNMPTDYENTLENMMKDLGSVNPQHRAKNLDGAFNAVSKLISHYEKTNNVIQNNQPQVKVEPQIECHDLIPEQDKNKIRALRKLINSVKNDCNGYKVKDHDERGKVVGKINKVTSQASDLLKCGQYELAMESIDELYNNIDAQAAQLQVREFQSVSPKSAWSVFTKPLTFFASSVAPQSDAAKYGVVKTNTAKRVVNFKEQFKILQKAVEPQSPRACSLT